MFGKWTLDGVVEFVRKLEAALEVFKRDLDYKLNVMGMHKTYPASEEGNLDNLTPLVIDVYIPPTTKSIKQVLVRFRRKNYEAYSDRSSVVTGYDSNYSDTARWKTAVDLGSETTVDGSHDHSASTVGAGNHDHGGAVGVDGSHTHSVSIGNDGSHAHYLHDHDHYITVGNHVHEKVLGIAKGDLPTDVQVYVNGNVVGGPYNDDVDELDVTTYVVKGWNEISFTTTAATGRLRANVWVDYYAP